MMSVSSLTVVDLEMHRAVVDGVPVVWTPGPAPLSAALVFGCGARDESLPTIGVTHMIEHLAMSALPKLHHPHNASVGMSTTEFVVEGRPDQVAAFLLTVCRALSDLPLARIDSERGVLEAEDGMVTHPTTAALMSQRFGVRGPGLAWWVGPGHHGVSEDAVAAHASGFFTRGNAVLTLTGPPPEGLHLPLLPGDRPSRPPYPAVPQEGPLWCAYDVPSPGLALSTRYPDPAAAMGIAVLQERLTDIARHQHGISYSVELDGMDVTPTMAERVVRLDARAGQEERAARVLWEQAQDLADNGPTPEELGHERTFLHEMWQDPRAVAADLDLAARAELFGHPPHSRSKAAAERAQVTPTAVAAAMRQAMRSAILVVPEDVRLQITTPEGQGVPEGGCPRTRTVPGGAVYRAPLLERGMSKEARAARLVQLQDGFAFVDGEGDVHTVLFDDVVGVADRPDGRVLFSQNACVVPVTHELWPRVAPAIARIDERVPQHLHFQAPDRAGVPEATTDVETPRWMVVGQRWQWLFPAAVSVYMASQAADALLPALTLTDDVYGYTTLTVIAAGGSYWRYRRDNRRPAEPHVTSE